MKAAQLGLVGAALAGALALEKQFPDIVFTSGRRGVADQARAMAANIASNLNWIAQTYVSTPQSRRLQQVVTSAHGHGASTIANLLVGEMMSWSDAEKAALSKHFSGQAFDVQPIALTPYADKVKDAIRALPGLTKFLEHEGGLVRWHAQFA